MCVCDFNSFLSFLRFNLLFSADLPSPGKPIVTSTPAKAKRSKKTRRREHLAKNISDEHTRKSAIVPDIHGPDLGKQERDGKNSLLRCRFNPLNPLYEKRNSHLLFLYVFYGSNGEKLLKNQLDSSCVIMSLILVIKRFYKALIFQGEI